MSTKGMALNQLFERSLLNLLRRWLLTICVVLFSAACADGYPTEDELIISPFGLNQFQQLEAMNQLGQDAHADITWIYRALPSCTMQMTVNGLESGKQTFSLQMSGAGVDISFNKADQVYGVQVQPAEGASLEERSVLLSKTWVDAVEMINLVRSFQVGCQMSTGPVSVNNTNPS
jgi:hypothetical protein